MTAKSRDQSTPRDRFEQLVTTPPVAQFVYYFVITVSGYLILRIIIRDGLMFGRSIFYILVWFILIISTKPPKGAELESDPFLHPDIVPGDNLADSNSRLCMHCHTDLTQIIGTDCPTCGEPIEHRGG